MQDGKFRACCCPGIVIKLRRKFVFHIVTAGFIKLFESSNEVADEGVSGTGAIHLEPKTKMKIWTTRDDTEVPAPAHISQDSDSERPTKVVSKSRKH